jgi:FkbM family methyltransferase
MFKKLFKDLALAIHIQHNKAYSYYKIRDISLSTEQSLDAEERDFYLSLRSVLQQENLVIYDIGAARGVTARCFAKLSNVSKICAFEPIPEAYSKLVNNVESFSKVSCHNVALGSEEDTLTMNISSNRDSSSLLPMLQLHQKEFPQIDMNNQIQVPVVRLDDYVERHQLTMPDVVKIDVQGYEIRVINGGVKTISQSKYCVLEMSFQPLYDGSPLFDEVYSRMRDLGFKLVGLTTPLTGKSGLPLQVDGIFENKNYN